MWQALLWSCRDPILKDMDAVSLPTLASAAPIREVPVVAVSGREVLLDPTPWRELFPDAVPTRVLSLDAEQGHEFALPALVEALEPLREAAAAVDRPPVFAVAAGADVPYRAVVRVLYSLGMAQISEVELRVTTPAGPGSVPYEFPGACAPSSAAPRPPVEAVPEPAEPQAEPVGAPSVSESSSAARSEAAVRLLELLSAGSGPCVLPTVTEVPGGLLVTLDEVEDGRAGCVSVRAGLEDPPPAPPHATDWRGAVVVPAPDACPSVPGRDRAALDALLDRAATLGEPCPSATLTALDATPWGEVVGLLAVLREHHDGAALGVTQGEPVADCAPSWVLGL